MTQQNNKQSLTTLLDKAFNEHDEEERKLLLAAIMLLFYKEAGLELIDLSVHFAQEFMRLKDNMVGREGEDAAKNIEDTMFKMLKIDEFEFCKHIIETYMKANSPIPGEGQNIPHPKQYLGTSINVQGDLRSLGTFHDFIHDPIISPTPAGKHPWIYDTETAVKTNKMSLVTLHLLESKESAERAWSKVFEKGDGKMTPLSYACTNHLNASVFALLNNLTSYSDIHLNSIIQEDDVKRELGEDEDTYRGGKIIEDSRYYSEKRWIETEFDEDGKVKLFEVSRFCLEETAFTAAISQHNIPAIIMILLHCIIRQDYLSEDDLSFLYSTRKTKEVEVGDQQGDEVVSYEVDTENGNNKFLDMIAEWVLCLHQTPSTLCKIGDRDVMYCKRGTKKVAVQTVTGRHEEEQDNIIESTGLLGILRKLSFMFPKSVRLKVEAASNNVRDGNSHLAERIFVNGLEECLFPGKDLRVMSFWLRRMMNFGDSDEIQKTNQSLSEYLEVHPEAHRALHYYDRRPFDVDFNADMVHDIPINENDFIADANTLHPNPIIFLSKEYNKMTEPFGDQALVRERILRIITHLICKTGMTFPAVSGPSTPFVTLDNGHFEEITVQFGRDEDEENFKFFHHIIHEMAPRVWFLLRQAGSYPELDIDTDDGKTTPNFHFLRIDDGQFLNPNNDLYTPGWPDIELDKMLDYAVIDRQDMEEIIKAKLRNLEKLLTK